MSVLNTDKDMLAILTTSSGKSMIPLIPAMLEDNKLTVLILPLKSLLMDYKRKLEAMGVPFLHYTGRDVPRGYCTSNLVLVGIEAAREEHWAQWLSEVDIVKHVQRYCFDEGQYPLTDAFRPCLRDVYMLRTLPRPMIVFSGTLNPSCESKIMEMFMLHDDTRVFRSPSTNRPEFQLIKAISSRQLSMLPNVVDELWSLHNPTFGTSDRAIVFVPTISIGRAITATIGCEFFNSEDQKLDKNGVYDRWRAGQHKIMVSTSAFSCGNDYAHVRLVIHAGTPRQMIGYIQEISRGGRDKQQTFCYLLPTSKWGSASSSELDDYLGVKEMANMCFGTNKRCLRHMITEYNDGHGVSCCDDENNFRCSVCLPTAGLMPSLLTHAFLSTNPLKRKTVQEGPDNFKKAKPTQPPPPVFASASAPPPPAPAPVMSASMKKTMDKIQQAKQRKFTADVEIMQALQTNLELMMGECAACFWLAKIAGGSTYRNGPHEFTACNFLKLVHGQDYCKFKDRISYNNNIHIKICFICHIPSFGEKLHGKFLGPNSCRYLDIILPTLFFGYINMRSDLERKFKQTWPTLMEFATWLSGKLINPNEKSNLISVFMFICSYF